MIRFVAEEVEYGWIVAVCGIDEGENGTDYTATLLTEGGARAWAERLNERPIRARKAESA